MLKFKNSSSKKKEKEVKIMVVANANLPLLERKGHVNVISKQNYGSTKLS
jgi:hypothetical protein